MKDMEKLKLKRIQYKRVRIMLTLFHVAFWIWQNYADSKMTVCLVLGAQGKG